MTTEMTTEMKTNTIGCKEVREHMADLLLDETFAASHAGFAGHMAACGDCSAELTELRHTFAAMDAWEAPEPSAYFDTRLHARLREEVAAQPEGFVERVRSFFLFSTGRMMRPVMVGALGLVFLVGGGTFAGLHPWKSDAQTSATVNDLRILDNNAQALQQMDQLLDDSGNNDDGGNTPPVS